MKDRAEEHAAQHAAGATRVERDGDVLRGAQPERQDRREEDHAQRHEGDLHWPESVSALVEGEPGGRAKEERNQKAGVAEEAEEDHRHGRAEGAARILRGLGVRFGRQAEGLLQPLGDEVLVRGGMEDHRDEQERPHEREHGGKNRLTLAGRTGERGGTFTGRGRHDYSPKRVPCEAASAAPGGLDSACRWRGGRVTRAARACVRSWARRSTIPARAWRIHLGVKEAAE